MVDSKEYYVYVYYRLDNFEPFYVGKGKNDRWKLTRKRNPFFLNTLNKYGAVVNFEFENLTEEEAYSAEVWLIHELRDTLGYELTNITDGGDCGPTTMKGAKHHRARAVVLTNTGELFLTLKDAEVKGAGRGSITLCCKRETSFAGRMPNGDAMIWRYADEYDKNEKHDYGVRKIQGSKNHRSQRIVLLNTGEVFETVRSAAAVYPINRNRISKCCMRKCSYAGKVNGTKLIWRYFEEGKKSWLKLFGSQLSYQE